MPSPNSRGERHGAPRGYLLSFDFGKRRIGVAVGQTQTGTATAIGTVSNGDKPDWNHLSNIVDEWQPTLFIIGLPLAEDGGETPMSSLARAFGEQLGGRYGIEVDFFDERLTSKAAEQQFAEMRAKGGARRKDASRMDAMAARIILENWLSQNV
ncbi:MAG: Holliday junction resolvase RuvX [Xanthomonadales bacterium]|nr:Holliday junction resolvase RuvX [Xanthomonadales bacterium]